MCAGGKYNRQDGCCNECITQKTKLQQSKVAMWAWLQVANHHPIPNSIQLANRRLECLRVFRRLREVF